MYILKRVLNSRKHLLTSDFQWLHFGLTRWTKSLNTSLVLSSVTDHFRSKSQLVAENALLRQQLLILRRQVKRPGCTKADRNVLVLLARAVQTWKQALFIVQPETLLYWHREGFRLFWKQKSKVTSHKPKVAPETISLIKAMAKNNQLWEPSTFVVSCSSWIFAYVRERSRNICGKRASRDREDRIGRHSCAIMLRRFGHVISCKSLTSSSALSSPFSSSNWSLEK